jgi:hypothetical protein
MVIGDDVVHARHAHRARESDPVYLNWSGAVREDARPTVAGKAIQIYGYIDLLFTQQQGNSGVVNPGSINPLIEVRAYGMRPWA